MKVDKLLQFFVVKEKRFFPMFVQSAENIKNAARLLLEQTKEEDAEIRRDYAHRIKESETLGDHITDKIIDEVLDAVVTPFDREDIHQLAEDMDTFLDCIRDCSKKIAIYQPRDPSHKVIEIAEYVLRDAEIISEITGLLDNMRDKARELDRLCDIIKENEHIVDDIYESYMSNLFEFEKDPIELVKKKNIIQAVEDTSDVAKALSSTVRSIVVKLG